MGSMEYSFRRHYCGAVKAVVFDLAGTVVDFGSCAPAAAFIELFRRHGIVVTRDEARRDMGIPKKEHLRRIASLPTVCAQWEKQSAEAWNDGDIDRLYEEFVPLQLEILPRYGKAIDGAAETFERLRREGVKIGVTTGYDAQMMDSVLHSLAAQGLTPDAAVCAGHVPAGRPAPWMLYLCMQALDVYPPESTVKIGDTIADIEEGLNAGAWSIGVVRTGNMIGLDEPELLEIPRQEATRRVHAASLQMARAGAHYVIGSVAECGPVLDEIGRRLAAGERP